MTETSSRVTVRFVLLAVTAMTIGCTEQAEIAACAENATCIYIDPHNTSHQVSALMFGSQTEFLNSGTGVWDSIVTGDCNDPAMPVSKPHQEMLAEFTDLGINFLRYPSGIPTDFFHWYESIGPIDTRVPQINPWISTATDIKRECPVFGPDEFAEYAEMLGASKVITTNVGSGTAQEAADWLDYYETRGVKTDYWEVGNEIYIQDADFLFSVYMTPEEYAAAYDAHAKALRQVKPDVTVGVVMSPMEQDWNRGVLEAITEPFDFITLHSFQPQIETCNNFSDTDVYRSLLASPLLLEVQLNFIKDAASELSLLPENQTPKFMISEWGPWFLHTCKPGDLQNNDDRARSMASVLFSGIIFNTMMRDPAVFSAIHSSLANSRAQAILNIVWDENLGWIPMRSGYYYIQQLYSESSGGTVIPTTTRNSPVFSAKLFDRDTVAIEQPVLDSIAVLSEDESRLFVYVANRSLTDAVDFQLLIGDLPYTVTSVVTDSVMADHYTDMNTIDNTDAIRIVSAELSAGKSLNINLPAHTLIRITFNLAKS